MFGPFDDMFDFNRDGHLDTIETALEMSFIADLMRNDEMPKKEKRFRGVCDDDDDDEDDDFQEKR